MANISLKNVYKRYPGDVIAVSDLNLEIQDKEFIILVGPSGCGKSTTLRMIAGLEDVTQGDLLIGEKRVNDVPSKDRDIAMVFQNYALYPHMSVYKNMAFALKLRHTPRSQIDERVRTAANALDIAHLLDRKPKALSGGQRQRVALGRAMVRDPAVFLLDEPLSNLDAKLRAAMRTEITQLHKRLDATFVYVTHDQTEAMTMGDRIVVMKDGYVQQVDTPQNLYDHPCNAFVAGFIGSPQMNFLPARLRVTNGVCAAFVQDMPVEIGPEKIKQIDRDYMEKEWLLGIRPENLYITEMSDEYSLRAYVDLVANMGSEAYLYLSIGETKLTARVPACRGIREGDTLALKMDKDKIHLFDMQTKQAI